MIQMFLPSKTSATRHCWVEHQADGEKQRFTNILSKKAFFSPFFKKISPINSVTRSNGNNKKTSGPDESLRENVSRVSSHVTAHEWDSDTPAADRMHRTDTVSHFLSLSALESNLLTYSNVFSYHIYFSSNSNKLYWKECLITFLPTPNDTVLNNHCLNIK